MVLYDISTKVIDNLNLIYKDCDFSIRHKTASVNDIEVIESDFLFIDPPGLYSKKNNDYPKLDDLLLFDEQSKCKNTVIWLPIMNPERVEETTSANQSVAVCRNKGFCITKVRWAKNEKMIGCFLAYKIPKIATTALRSATENIATLAKWKNIIKNPVQHFESTP